jgi:WD40 repeat protein
VSLSFCGVARAQGDRFGRFEPGLIVETGARMGACDVVTFTPDGEFLLACGDDKVVRIWKHTGQGLEPQPVQILRWSIFREQRGNIYAMALSPDPECRYVAVGGLGVRAGAASLALLDRPTGQVQQTMREPPTGLYYSVWSVAFAPSGRRVAFGRGDGLVGVWDLQAEPPKDILYLGQHKRSDGGLANKVRLVAFLDEDRLLSLAEDGELRQWNLAQPSEAPKVLHRFAMTQVWQARLSSDRQLIGAISQRDPVKAAVYSLKSGRAVEFRLNPHEQPHSLAIDAAGRRLALGTWVHPALVAREDPKAAGGRVALFDPESGKELRTALRYGYYMDAMAFHPKLDQLAIGGGANHEVTLWDIGKANAAPLGKIIGPGRCLWGVALSPDGRHLGYLDEVDIFTNDVNRRGKGEWHVFDLQKRSRVPSKGFSPVRPLETAAGWKVRFTKDVRVWEVVNGAGKAFPLPLDWVADALPRCYTFLPGKPPRLAVGHFWGFSIFELTPDGPVRRRLTMGHQGEVMAIAPSADGKLLVTASRDMTLAAWSLADWPSQPELGVRFALRQGKLLVDEVDPGSPGWEAGLSRNDEVTLLAFFGQKVEGGPEAWLARLRQPVPGKELFFELRRPGREQPVRALTKVMQRPLWRFFPTQDGEWVLWRWRDYYYDSSTNGDSYIGWQVSGDVDVTPAFYKAEQFRQRFYRPDKVAAMLAGLDAPERVSIPDIEPPDVQLQVAGTVVKDQDVTVTLRARSRGEQANHRLDRVLFWINDFQFKTISADGTTFEKKLVIPRDRFRAGTNVLTLQCYNKAEMRGEAPPVLVESTRPAPAPRLYGLFVGVGDYRQSRRRVADLNADRDAEALHEAWLAQKRKFFEDVHLEVLTNRQATPAAILKHLAALAPRVRPDDSFLLFLGGHGTSAEELAAFARQSKLPLLNELPPRSFAFLGPAFDPQRPYDTCVTSKDLYEAIARLPCRKVVLLDACRSGTVAVNPVRELTRDGVGPVIVAACQPNEQAIEFGLIDSNRAYGLFTMAVRRALNEEFDQADGNRDRQLEAGELAAFIKERVPKLVQQLKDLKVEGIKDGDTQVPAEFLPRLEAKAPVARK